DNYIVKLKAELEEFRIEAINMENDLNKLISQQKSRIEELSNLISTLKEEKLEAKNKELNLEMTLVEQKVEIEELKNLNNCLKNEKFKFQPNCFVSTKTNNFSKQSNDSYSMAI